VKAKVTIDGETFSVIIKRNEERNFDTSSDYDDPDHLLCLPKVIVFIYLLQTKGQNYFESIRNWDKEKNKLLEAYGYSLKDNLKGKFEFNYKDGKPYLRVLDNSIKRITVTPSSTPKFEKPVVIEEEEAPPVKEQVVTNRLGIVFNFNRDAFPFFSVDLIEGEMSEEGSFAGKVEKLDLSKYINVEDYAAEDKNLLLFLRKLQDAEVNKYVSRNSPFSGFWENIIHQEGDDLPEETKSLIAEYMLPKLTKLVNEFKEAPSFTLQKGKSFKTANLEKIELSDKYLTPFFSVSKKDDEFEVDCMVKPDGVPHGLDENEAETPLLFLYNHQLYLWDKKESLDAVEPFLPLGIKTINVEDWPQTLSKQIMPLTKEYKVEFDRNLVDDVKEGEPEVKLFLNEKGEYLVFQPVFTYKGYDTRSKDKDEL
jgi:non-specific serine/threonine protein kinase